MRTITRGFDVEVVDGEGLPVPGVEIGARYHYADEPAAWSTGTTDGDGFAYFDAAHPSPPTDVALFIDDAQCGTYPLQGGDHLTVEL